MSLSSGTRFGPYAVAAKIGEGGMGGVCRDERWLPGKRRMKE